MADFPTVGLNVDLTGIDAGEAAYGKLKRTIEGVGQAADDTSKKVQGAARTSTASSEGAVKASQAEARAATQAAREAETQRRYLLQVRINSIQMEEAARRAAQAEEARAAVQQAKILAAAAAEAQRQAQATARAQTLAAAEAQRAQEMAARAAAAADAAAAAEMERTRKYLLQVRLNSFRMEESAAGRAAAAQIALEKDIERQVIATAARRAEAQALLSRAPAAQSATAQMADQIKAQEAAYLAEAQASALAATARNASTVSMEKAAAATVPLATGLDSIALKMAAQMKISVDEARAILNTTKGYEGMFPALNGVSVATDEYRIRAEKLKAALDPAARAQQLLAARTLEANELMKAGAITQVEYTALMKLATKEAEHHGNAMSGSSLKVREFLVLIREAVRGDFSRFAGSTTIMAGAFGLMTAAIVGTALVVAALAAPFLILAAAMAKGSSESAKLANAITVTNGAVGLTATEIENASTKIAKSLDYSQGKTLALMTHLTATGKVNAESISLVAAASIKLSQLTGEAADKISDKLVGSFDDAAKGAVDLNEKYHFLTLAQYEQIEALQKAGDKQAAFTLLMTDLNANLATSTVNMGIFERVIHKVGEAFDYAWTAMKNFGKEPSVDAKLKTAQDNLRDLTNPKAYLQSSPDVQKAITVARQQVQDLKLLASLHEAMAKDDARVAQTQETGQEAHRHLMSVDPGLGGSRERMQEEITNYKAWVSAALKADPKDKIALADQENMAARIEAIKKKYDKMEFGKKPHVSFEGAIDGIAKMQRQIEGLKNEIDSISADPLAVLNAQIVAAGNAAAAAMESGKKKNQGLADQQRALAMEKERLVILKQLDQQSANNTRQTNIQADREAILATAQLKSTQIMKDFWSGATPTVQSYTDALEKSRKVTTDAAIAASDLGIAERFGVQSLNDITTALVLGTGASTEYAQRVEDQAKAEAAAAKAAILRKAALDALASHDSDIKAFNDTSYQQVQRDLQHITLLADNLGTSLERAFGKGGTALHGFLTALTTFSTKQADLNKRLADAQVQYSSNVIDHTQLIKVQEQVSSESAQNRIEGYANMAQAAQGFFADGSAGYQLMQKAEMAFRLIEFAMSAKSIVVKAVETAAKLGFFGEQAAAAATAGAAEMFATLGPAGFAAVAAMVAVLAGLGLALSGGVGGGPIPGANDMANRQKAQGSGSVLGDAAAKSSSIVNSLAIVAANTNKDLEFSNGMLTALKSIDSNISSLTGLLARQLQVGSGAFDTSKLGLGTSSKGPSILDHLLTGGISFLLPGLFGSKTTNTLQDQGLQFNSGTLSSVLSGGLTGSTYAQVASETVKKFLGITYSDKTKVSTTTGALDPAVQSQMTAVIASLRNGVLAAASVLGVQGAEATLNAMTVNLGKISFKDMTGQQIQDALNAVFGKLGDDMATTALPMITALQKVNEGAFETLSRVARDYQVLDISLSILGKTFGAVGVSSLAAREHLIDLAGGIDQLSIQVSDYASKFLTTQEQITPIITAVYTELGKMGAGSITTKDQFKALVNSLDLTTASGAQTFATLMKIAPAFAQITDYMASLSVANSDVATAQTALNDAYNVAASAIQATHDKFQAFVDSFKKFRQDLEIGAAALNSPQDQYLKTKALFESTAKAAAGGDVQALNDLQTVSQDYLTASKDYYASTEPYFADLAAVKAATNAALTYSQNQVSIADQQLAALNAMVAGQITLGAAILSVADALRALAGAQAAQAAAMAAATAAAQAAAAAGAAGATPPPTSTPTPVNDNFITNGSVDYNRLLSARPDVLAEYNRLIATADPNSPWFSAHGLDKGPTGFAAWWYNQGGGSSQYQAASASSPAIVPTDLSAGVASALTMPMAAAGTATASPSVSPSNGGISGLTDALQGVQTELQIANILAQAGHSGTIDTLGQVVDGLADVKAQIRAQAA